MLRADLRILAQPIIVIHTSITLSARPLREPLEGTCPALLTNPGLKAVLGMSITTLADPCGVRREVHSIVLRVVPNDAGYSAGGTRGRA
jgi:hypothetical protein